VLSYFSAGCWSNVAAIKVQLLLGGGVGGGDRGGGWKGGGAGCEVGFLKAWCMETARFCRKGGVSGGGGGGGWGGGGVVGVGVGGGRVGGGDLSGVKRCFFNVFWGGHHGWGGIVG